MVTIRRSTLCSALVTAVALAGCDLGTTVIPRTSPEIVVHAVLDAGASVQTVLVERSLTGSETPGNGFDPSSPIAGNGIPISGATVTLMDATGGVWTGVERRPPSGVYDITITRLPPGPSIVSGERYTLSVSAEGKTVTGSTIVPSVSPDLFARFQTFNRDRDSIRLDAADTAAFRALWVNVETPFEAFDLFSVDRHLVVSGQIRNPATNDLEHVFYPGWQQVMTVAAVDTNLYDYYRSGNDPFTGTGLISHLSGGLGLFGSLVPIRQTVYDVTQDPTGDSIEGRYTLRSGAATATIATDFVIYLEARGTGLTDRLSGLYHATAVNGSQLRGALIGTRTGNHVQLTLIDRYIFEGIVRGDTLIGSYADVPATFVKAGK